MSEELPNIPSDPIIYVPTVFRFNSDHTDQVYLIGSFTQWRDQLLMERDFDTPNGFEMKIPLQVGIHHFKFIVDGNWVINNDYPTIYDSDGNVNNCVNVTKPLYPHNIPHDWEDSGEHQTEEAIKHAEESISSLLTNQLMIPDTQLVEKKGNNPSMWVENSTVDNATTMRMNHKLLLVMVGLPARGKTFVAEKLARYLDWLGYNSRTFNFESYRQRLLGNFYSHDWYHPNNIEGERARRKVCLVILEDIFRYYSGVESGLVAILDGTNCTSSIRTFISNNVKNKSDLKIRTIFLEIICNDTQFVNKNILNKLNSPDYRTMSPQDAIIDYLERVNHYNSVYEPVSDNFRYVRVFEGEKKARQIVLNRVTGFIPSKVMFYLTNLQFEAVPLYFVRHGESEYNEKGLIGGDSPLTEEGRLFSKQLAKWVRNNILGANQNLILWSSTMKRAVETAKDIKCAQYIRWKSLEEISVGVCDGMSYSLIEKVMPKEFAARQADKLCYKYPRGESYEDLIRRVEPVIVELERRQNPTMVIGHQATLRCIYAYFSKNGWKRDQVPHIDIPSNCVIKVVPQAYGAHEERFSINVHDSTSP